MAKQNANLTVLGQLQSAKVPFLSSPMISAPNTIITDLAGNARTLRDPSKTVRPQFGTERILIKGVRLIAEEKGPNGEPVYGMNDDDRVRLIGAWTADSIDNGAQVRTSTVGDIVEITFYGTGLNYVLQADNTARTMSASIDGGSFGSNFYNNTYDDSQQGRSVSVQSIIPIASGLTLGNHTVRVRLDTGVNARVYGFEVVNSNANAITVPQGEIIFGGRKQVIASTQTLAYNTGFDGSPTLNGRGGRAVIYAKDGYLGKALTQTDSTSLFLGAATHVNEEPIKRINWRDFGAGRADDFSTLTTVAANRWFTLNDNLTTLVGQSVLTGGGGGTSVRATGAGNFITLTFIGTGLDIMTTTNDGNLRTTTITVDGTNVGILTQGATESGRLRTICSGLPYGTHTVQFLQNGSFDTVFTDSFVIYGPKEPTIPDNAVKIGEYYLMATYIPNTTAGVLRVGQGTARHHAAREFLFRGNTWAFNTSAVNFIGGLENGTNTNGDSITYTFWGTGFDFRGQTNTAGMNTLNVTLNGTPLTSANFPSAVANSYGGYSFNLTTGVLDANNASTVASGWNVSGLPLALYTLTITATSAGSPGFQCDCIDVVTPLHFPDTQNGSLSISKAVLSGDPDDQADANLKKVKAYLAYDGINGVILASYNIAGVVNISTGKGRIYFQVPFKNSNYMSVTGMLKNNTTDDGNISMSLGEAGNSGSRNPGSVKFTTVQPSSISLVDTVWFAVFYGELEGEE